MLALLAQVSGGYLFKEEAASGGPDVYLILGGFVVLIAVLLVLQLVRKRASPPKSKSGRNGGRFSAKRRKAKNRDALQEFTVSSIDMDPLIDPPTGRPRPIPEELPLGTVLISQRLGFKCLLLDHLEEVGRKTLKEICARKLRTNQAVYVPMGSQLNKGELSNKRRTSRIFLSTQTQCADFTRLISTLHSDPPRRRSGSATAYRIAASSWLATLLALSALLSPVDSSEIRVATLGGESRFMHDNTNVFAFPARAVDFPHAGFEIFDEWAGVVLPVGKASFAGLFFNRPTPQLATLNSYIQKNGSAVFQELQVKPWIDLLYARRLGERLNLGFAGRVSYDVLETDGNRASARQSDLRAGFRLGNKEGAQLDAAVGLQLHDLRDTINQRPPNRETDGTGMTGELRLLTPLGENMALVNFIGFESSSYALAPSQRETRTIEMGTGLNLTPAANILLVGGVSVSNHGQDLTKPGQPKFEEDVLTLPAIHLAAEAQQGSMIFRLGMRHATELVDRKQAGAGTPSEILDSHFDIQLGLGLEFGPVLLDGHLERDFLRDGPDFIGGSRHGGGILSRISVTHRMR